MNLSAHPGHNSFTSSASKSGRHELIEKFNKLASDIEMRRYIFLNEYLREIYSSDVDCLTKKNCNHTDYVTKK